MRYVDEGKRYFYKKYTQRIKIAPVDIIFVVLDLIITLGSSKDNFMCTASLINITAANLHIYTLYT